VNRFGLLIAFLFGLLGCTESQRPEDVVHQLSEARWQAMMEADYKKAWDYLAPGFRKRVPLDAYTLRFAGKTRWTGARIVKVACEDVRCEVDVDADYHYVGNASFAAHDGQQDIKEVWIQTDGHWWHMPRK